MASKQKTHTQYTFNGAQVAKEDVTSKSDKVTITVPKGTPYVTVRKTLELALLRVR